MDRFKNLLFFLLLLGYCSAVENDEKCYEVLEIYQTRWIIQQYYNRMFQYTYFESGTIPNVQVSEAKYKVRFYQQQPLHEVEDQINKIYLYAVEIPQQLDYVEYDIMILGKDFEETGNIAFNTNNATTRYARFNGTGDRVQLDYARAAAQYRDDHGANVIFIQIKRLRKLPACLGEGDKDVGTGSITVTEHPKITAERCVWKTYMYSDHPYCFRSEPLFFVHRNKSDDEGLTFTKPNITEGTTTEAPSAEQAAADLAFKQQLQLLKENVKLHQQHLEDLKISNQYQSEISTLKFELSEKKNEPATNQSEVDTLKFQLTEKNTELAAKDLEIEKLKDMSKAKDNVIAELQKKCPAA